MTGVVGTTPSSPGLRPCPSLSHTLESRRSPLPFQPVPVSPVFLPRLPTPPSRPHPFLSDPSNPTFEGTLPPTTPVLSSTPLHRDANLGGSEEYWGRERPRLCRRNQSLTNVASNHPLTNPLPPYLCPRYPLPAPPEHQNIVELSTPLLESKSNG